MRSFLEQYGTAIFTLVIISILIAFAGPVGTMIKTNVNTQIKNVNEIGSERVKNVGRAEEPKEAVDEVYCILYDDGELTISQTEITPDENRTVLNKGYFTNPKDVDTTEGKQHIITVRFMGGVKPKSCRYWFGELNENLNHCKNLIEINNIENLYTNECTNMIGMFNRCNKLQFLNLEYFDTSNVTNMNGMFTGCSSLKSLDVSNFDTSKVTDMSDMFAMLNINNINIGKLNTTNVVLMWHMFYGCNNLSLDCSSLNVSKVTDHTGFNTNSPNVIPPTWTN